MAEQRLRPAVHSFPPIDATRRCPPAHRRAIGGPSGSADTRLAFATRRAQRRRRARARAVARESRRLRSRAATARRRPTTLTTQRSPRHPKPALGTRTPSKLQAERWSHGLAGRVDLATSATWRWQPRDTAARKRWPSHSRHARRASPQQPHHNPRQHGHVERPAGPACLCRSCGRWPGRTGATTRRRYTPARVRGTLCR